MLKRSIFWMGTLFVLLFMLPSLISVGFWALKDRPSRWHEANWQSSGILPDAAEVTGAVIHIMAARTGGLKGAFSVHSWIVTKQSGQTRYNRYDKVGWGSPVRLNGYPADARWYSNPPRIVTTISGKRATELIPRIEAAIRQYPYLERGDYRIWPGPNSNSFVAHVLNEVPEIGVTLPPTAVGRDFVGQGVQMLIDPGNDNVMLSYSGLAGIAVGARSGFELQLFGLVAGVDFENPAIKLPAIGRIGMNLTPSALAADLAN